MNRLIALLIGVCFVQTCLSADGVDADIATVTRRVAARLEKSIKPINAETTVKIDEKRERFLSIEWRVREYQVYGRGKNGEWGKELRTILGPEKDGCRMTFYFQKGKYDGQLERSETPSLAAKSGYREPYFWGSYSKLEGHRVNAQVNITYGDMADSKVMQAVYDETVKVVDEEMEKEFGKK